MLGTRYENYEKLTGGLPFVLNTDIERSYYNRSRDNNWHENLEIQVCLKGSGSVLLDGERYSFNENDIVVVNSDVIHYTDTETSLVYSCLIISTEFCERIEINPNKITFSPHIKSGEIVNLFNELTRIYLFSETPLRVAKLNKLVLEILIILAENYTLKQKDLKSDLKSNDRIKATISYIRANYQNKISLDDISKAVLCDKYALCRDFKKLTGQTIIWHLNNYRSIKAIDCLADGLSVAETAFLCGFGNISFFTKTFKKHIGKLPSDYKK